MKYSVRTHMEYDTFEKVITFFSRNILHKDDVSEGRFFLYDLGDYLDDTKYPCDKMMLIAFTGDRSRFELVFYYQGKRVAFYAIEVCGYDLLRVHNWSYYGNKEMEDMFHSVICEYFDERNNEIFLNWMKVCGIVADGENEVKVTNFRDYKDTGSVEVLRGSLSEIFESYTTHNDKLRYCNGDYWRFSDNNVSVLYSIFVSNYKGNYFLDNAVKRGVIID